MLRLKKQKEERAAGTISQKPKYAFRHRLFAFPIPKPPTITNPLQSALAAECASGATTDASSTDSGMDVEDEGGEKKKGVSLLGGIGGKKLEKKAIAGGKKVSLHHSPLRHPNHH